MKIDDRLSEIKGIGPKRAEALERLGLFTTRDLLNYAPRAYLDLREVKKISDLSHGDYALIKIEEIGKTTVAYPTVNGRRTPLITVSVSDDTGSIRLRWFNQPYIRTSIPGSPGGYVHGRIDASKGKVMVNGAFCAEPPGMLPVYRLSRGLGQASIRSSVKSAIKDLNGGYCETLSEELRLEHGLCQLGFALENLHFPISPEALEISKRRFSFENTLYFTLLLETIRSRTLRTKGVSFKTSDLYSEFLKHIPFKPTKGQTDIMHEIENDMSSPVPMNRLIQGDVGSGKTLLAFYAVFIAIKNGYQAALMAPTGILAEQHYAKLKNLFGDSAALLMGSMKKSDQDAMIESIGKGKTRVVVGTHSLIESKVNFDKLGVVITDEQHRFGVRQRAYLSGKATAPDVLIMSATPIPRTLSLILYGDLDVSLLNEMPVGRKPVTTRFVPDTKRADMYRYIENQVKERGIQAFVVCPMIEDSEEESDFKSAEAVFEELSKKLSIRVGLIHGRFNADKRDEIMRSFRDGQIDLLVSTTVIEVGVDVPNACIMVIEAADRFGLAQLHQLRGRVGRSDKESFCFLLSDNDSETVAERIRTLVKSNNGFEISEKDLMTRGPGDLLGLRQHGSSQLLSALALSDLETLTEARKAAIKILSSDSPDDAALVQSVIDRYSESLKDIAIN